MEIVASLLVARPTPMSYFCLKLETVQNVYDSDNLILIPGLFLFGGGGRDGIARAVIKNLLEVDIGHTEV